MKCAVAFEYQLDEKKPRLLFLGYNHPDMPNEVEIFHVVPRNLDRLDDNWEVMMPVFSSEDSKLPRLWYKGR